MAWLDVTGTTHSAHTNAKFKFCYNCIHTGLLYKFFESRYLAWYIFSYIIINEKKKFEHIICHIIVY